MARKRSLKDAAADRLVEKPKVVAAAPVAATPKRAARRSAVKATPAPPAAPTPAPETPAFPAAVSAVEQRLPDAPPKAPEIAKKFHPALKWVALPLLIGFAGGYFFGVGQAIGPANLTYLLIGLAGGYFFARFVKIG